MFEFKTYSWVIGTTSFRVKEINYKIEEQLRALKELFTEHPGKKWRDLQIAYYDKISEKGIITGDAPRKDKDAREKTSGLKELGLITDLRHLTEAGEEILHLVEHDEIQQTNDFMIDADALIYLKQLLKLYVRDSEFKIRPFVALLYLLDKLDYLTDEEFTFLLPLCKNKEDVKRMVNLIESHRKGELSINKVILTYMNGMENYRRALHYFLDTDVITDGVICEVGMNRKSRKFDAPYYELYTALRQAALAPSLSEVEMKAILNALKKLKKPSARWKALIVGQNKSTRQQLEYFRRNFPRTRLKTENEKVFRKLFFQYMHLFKWKANLEEYADLNKRYFSLADVLLFQDEKVELTLFPKYFFHLCIDELLEEDINPLLLPRNISLEEISPALKVKTENVIALVSKKTGQVLDLPSMRNHFQREKERQLQILIDEKFSKEQLIYLFDLIDKRDDKMVQAYVTDNADVPTIFEYLLGISWYHISGQSFHLMDSWNLSLDANLLPKRHAGGGDADILIDYPATDVYPRHKLMLEATLTNSTNQRRAEMEPVSRHLGILKARNPETECYAAFVSNHLDTNVIVDLRSRKNVPFHDRATDTWVSNNKIIPLNTENIKTMLKKEIYYSKVYRFFAKAYESEVPYQNWYEETINMPLNEYTPVI